MSLSAPFIRRPVATTLLTIAVALAGAIAYPFLPVSPLPQVDFPTIVVTSGIPGASPQTMAAAVATPLERQFGRIAAVTEMTSSSTLGSASVVLQFDLSRDINGAARDVQAALNAARADLPANLPNNPIYRKINPTEAPVLILALASDTKPVGQVFDAAASILQQKLSQVDGVGQVTVGGGALPAVRVELNPLALSHYGISLADVRTAVADANATNPRGRVADDERMWMLTTGDPPRTAAGFAPLIVAWRNGAPVRLRDVASVDDGVQDLRTLGLVNGRRAVTALVYREPGANIIDTIDRVRALLPQLQASLPPGIDLWAAVDRTTTIRASVRDVERTLLLSIVLVVIVVFVFLRSARVTLIPGVVVPLSLIGTFAVMYLLGYSLDNLSLMALTISTGFVIDDAIVVVENVTRHIELGVAPREAALIGASEVGFTVLSMSASLVAVFIPILMMSGLVGRLFREFAVTLSVAIAVSLVLSLTTTPMLCAWLLKPRGRADAPPANGRKPEQTDGHGGSRGGDGGGGGIRAWRRARGALAWIGRTSELAFTRVTALYGRALQWVLRHTAAMAGLTLGVAVLSVALAIQAPKGFFPQQDTGILMGTIQARQDISFQAMHAVVQELAAIVQRDPAVDSVVVFAGGGLAGSSSARMFIALKPLEQRAASAMDVIARLRRPADVVPGAQLFLQPAQDLRVGGRQGNALYQFTLAGDDYTELTQWSPRVAQRLSQLPELTDVNSDQQNGGRQASLAIDRDAASRLGLTMQTIDASLYGAFGQSLVSTIYEPLNQYHVVMEAAPKWWQSPDTLHDVHVSVGGDAATPTGPVALTGPAPATNLASPSHAVPLDAVAKTRLTSTPLAVAHQSQSPAVTISFNLASGVSLGDAMTAINAAMQTMGVPPTIRGSFQGTASAFQDALRTQTLLIVAALVAIYIVLGVLYESYLHPLTILSTLPSAGVGALLALRLAGLELSVVALIGILLLIGIVKKNAIMMIDVALAAERGQGTSPEVAIYEACLLRFRPILMTTLAALLGSLPLAFATGIGSELRRPLGMSIAGGLIVSQLLTLFTTPVVYVLVDRLRSRAIAGRRRLVAVFAGLMMSACSLAPHYVTPATTPPPAWKEAGASSAMGACGDVAVTGDSSASRTAVPPASGARRDGHADPAAASPGGRPGDANCGDVSRVFVTAAPGDGDSRGAWWETFGDPTLSSLMARVSVSNQTLKAAEAQYAQARALVRAGHAEYFPTVSTTPSAIVSRASTARAAVSASSPSGSAGGEASSGRQFREFVLPVDASYEPDLWGRVRNTVSARQASAQASAGDVESVRLSLQASLAADYFALRSLDARTRLLQQTVLAFERALELTKARARAGVVSGADVAQAQTQLETARAQVIDVGVERAQLEHAIAVLMGQAPATFSLPFDPLTREPPAVPLLLPSALLQRRPDIAAAERRVAASNAQIGVARAAYFPALTLSGSGGFDAASLATLIAWPSRVWSLGASVAATLFDGGSRKAGVEQARATYDQTVAEYRQTVLQAFQDTEDNLAALRILADEARQQDAAIAAAQRSLDLATAQYKAGTVSYLSVVTAQTALLDNELNTVAIQQRRLAACVQLITALGGGWSTASP